MSSDNDDDIRRLLNPSPITPANQTSIARALKRARASVAQRDTLAFAIVRIWTTLAALLAPLFATLATKQARAGLQRGPQTDFPKNPQ